MFKAAIVGASGYTGAELLRILWGHPGIEVAVATAKQYAGEPIGSLYPSLAMQYSGKFQEYSPEILDGCDIVFCGLPHGQSMGVVSEAAAAGMKVVDLSADFRLTADEYQQWYGLEHASPQMLKSVPYGIPEINRDLIAAAQVVANPGCFPTASLLGLAPLAKAGVIGSRVIIDSKTGVSGAGRKLTLGTHYPQVADNILPYGVAGHRHLPEIWGELEKLTGEEMEVVFTPHLAPMNRGILSTMYVSVPESATPAAVRSLYDEAFLAEPFVHVLAEGKYPETKAVQGTNNCHLAIETARGGMTLVVMAAIDNLVKGASGQAIQNANLMLGLEETSGLEGPGLFP